MKTRTIQEVIKAVPLTDEIRKKLLAEYESYNDAMKFEIMHTCWNAFDDMTDLIQEDIYRQFMNEVAQGKRTIGDDFTDQVDKAVDDEIDAYITGKKFESDSLEEVRSQLRNLITHSSG